MSYINIVPGTIGTDGIKPRIVYLNTDLTLSQLEATPIDNRSYGLQASDIIHANLTGNVFYLMKASLSNTTHFVTLTAISNSANVSFYNVKDFGAVCNGVTDDTAAIQATINAAQAASPMITGVLIPGFSVISSPLTITQPIRLFGWARAMCGIIGTNYSADLIDISVNTTGLNNQTGITITDLLISYSQATQNFSNAGTYGIKINATAEIVIAGHIIERCQFLGCYNALSIDGSQSNIVRSCNFQGCGQSHSDWTGNSSTGVTILNTLNSDYGDSTIEGCYFGQTAICIEQLSSGGLRVINNKFNSMKNAYWLNYNAQTVDLFISNNSIEGNTDHAIKCTSQIGGTYFNTAIIANNEIQTPYGTPNTANGIYISMSFAKLVITGNNFVGDFEGVTQTMISLTGVAQFLIADNMFSPWSGTIIAYYIDASCSSGTIGINNYSGSVTPGVNNSSGVTYYTRGTIQMTAGTATITNTMINTGCMALVTPQQGGINGILNATCRAGACTITSTGGSDAALLGYTIQ